MRRIFYDVTGHKVAIAVA